MTIISKHQKDLRGTCVSMKIIYKYRNAIPYNNIFIFHFRYWKGFVVDPSQSYYYRWLFVISIAVLYNIIFIIARATFLEMQQEYVSLWFTLDYFSDFLYLLDMVISAKTGKHTKL